ncbi:MAG: oligopeptide transport system substrate-binding protein [Limisphaerales bacterium]|jgi:oligopeptide transport system substrate-binding protein
MKRILQLCLVVLMPLVISSCGGSADTNDSKGSNSTAALSADLEALPGGVYRGGVFRYNETEYLRSLFPLNVSEVVGHRIANQIYEGLVKLSQDDLSVVPGIAESWTISEDGLTYRFNLRKGVTYHNDDCFEGGIGREVTANDFGYCFTQLCTPGSSNKGSVFVRDRIKGARAWFDAHSNGTTVPSDIPGIRVIDDYTFEIELEQPFSAIMGILSMPFCYAWPQEAYEAYDKEMRIKAVGTGPFYLKRLKENDNVVLLRNDNYWAKDEEGNKLPYLQAVNVRFISEEKSELLAFQKGEFDMKFRIPSETYDQIVDRSGGLRQLTEEYSKYQLQFEPTMGTEYYGFLHPDPDNIFDNKLVREAFCYSIDREKLCNYVMKGTADPAIYGIVPLAFAESSGYPIENIKGFNYDPERARALMEEAGYAPGEFPKITLSINSGGGRNEQVASFIINSLKETIGVIAEIQQIEFAQHYENLESGKARFWRAGWIGDFPDPENFLNLLYGKNVPDDLSTNSYTNSVRYRSDAFDAKLTEALATIDEEARLNLYAEADQIAMNDAAILPIYYNVYHRLLQPDIRNFPMNAMEYRDFSRVYKVPSAQ